MKSSTLDRTNPTKRAGPPHVNTPLITNFVVCTEFILTLLTFLHRVRKRRFYVRNSWWFMSIYVRVLWCWFAEMASHGKKPLGMRFCVPTRFSAHFTPICVHVAPMFAHFLFQKNILYIYIYIYTIYTI